jgi:hypothetical protein
MFFEIGAPVFEVSIVALTMRDCDHSAQGSVSSDTTHNAELAESVFPTARRKYVCIVRLLLVPELIRMPTHVIGEFHRQARNHTPTWLNDFR